MNRKLTLVLVLLLCASLLCGCAQRPTTTFQVAGSSNLNLTPETAAPTEDIVSQLGYDPLAEEEEPEEVTNQGGNMFAFLGNYTTAATPAPTQSSEYRYAGATPMPLLPIDAPTPTPKPALSWEYTSYTASGVGVIFDGPVGWSVDESVAGTIRLTEPLAQQHDGYTANITISRATVNSHYSKAELKNEVNRLLKEICDSGFNSGDWSPSLTAERTLMGYDGVYANFSGTLPNGVRVRGRVHVTCISKNLYTIICMQPAGFNTDYLNIYGKIRETMKKVN